MEEIKERIKDGGKENNENRERKKKKIKKRTVKERREII